MIDGQSMDKSMSDNWVIKLTASEAGEVHDYSCLMVDVPKDLKTMVLGWNITNIPDSDLFKEDRSGKGRELQPHITVKYGIHEEAPDPVFALIPNKEVPFELGQVTRFTSGDSYDVIIVEILSPGLHSLNSEVSLNFECTDTFPVYKPHLTLAYVNKGALPHLDGQTVFEGQKDKFDTFLFTNPNNDLFTKRIK